MAKPKTTFDRRFLFLLPLPVLWCVVGHWGGLQFVENRLTDLRYWYRGDVAVPVKVVYVDIDTRAIQAIGERPWDRGKFGAAAQALVEIGGAKAVGFDVVFSPLAHSELVDSAKDNQGTVAFGRVIHQHANIVLAAQYTTGDALTQLNAIRRFPLLREGRTDRTKNDVPEMPQYPLVGPTWGRVGLIDIDYGYGGDEVPRWVPLFAETPNPTLYHMALQLALVQFGLDESAVRNRGDALELVRPDGVRVGRVPLTARQLVEVNWFSRWEDNPHVSLADVLMARDQLTAEGEAERAAARKFFAEFRDAIVLVGATDELLLDLAPTPLNRKPVPRVSVHGNLLKTMVSGQYLWHLPEWGAVAIILALTLAIASLVISEGAKGVVAKITAVALAAVYVVVSFQLFKQFQVVLPIAVPLGSAFSTSFAALIWQVVEEERQKSRIKGMFGTYLSPELVNRMINSAEDPKLGGHEEVITAYFSDIESFSALAEKMAPARLVEFMNEYFTACTDILQEEGGTLDKYIGDAVVAMFGAPIALPDHAYRACVASQRVQGRIAELREKWRGEGERWPEITHRLRARLGLNTGPAIIGNMGSRSRFSYTMAGDNVNLAARMESGAKLLGVYTMVTDATRKACEKHDGAGRIVFRCLDRIVVKGRSQPVGIHEIVGFKEGVSQQTSDCLGLYAQGFERYLAQDWEGAAARFQQSAGLEANQPPQMPGLVSNPSLVLLARCRDMRAHPPGPDWNGVYVMPEK
ncbi:MAG TPA: adenylate/guanylate cyclase domain-containing protein [Opitutaceae bacterium]|nr:adenylate/guanylate cyclase domain-containing protein [Opitutaceae bacterium]